eukprot:TRINITY_DN2233_c0_g2_i1.p1 TRINITY_DN2233_c0_g2~~TRINITY_DN2233_c0_g2_i1.p1  ORF type:complete len:716 (-),score=212.44 TRINITY_DN2233_c0_g2_i1:481-2628(-)
MMKPRQASACLSFFCIFTTFVLARAISEVPCLANDFGIAYQGDTIFTVSSANNTCSCTNFASSGLAYFQTAVVPNLATGLVSSVNGTGLVFAETAEFSDGLLLNGTIRGSGAAGYRQVKVVDVLNVGSLVSISGAYQCGGLQAKYYGNINLQDLPACTQTEPVMSLVWGGGPCPICAGDVGCSSWSARFSGSLLAPTTDDVTLSFYVTGGIRVWINNVPEPVIDSWSPQTAKFFTASVPMIVGRYYPIRIEFYQTLPTYQLVFQWYWTGTGSALVPTASMCTATGVQVAAGLSTFSDQVTFNGPTLFVHGIGSPATSTNVLGPMVHAETVLFSRGATLASGQTFFYGTSLIQGTSAIVSGHHTVNGVLNVTGKSYYGGTVYAAGNLVVAGALISGGANVTGKLTADRASAGTLTASGLITATAGLTVSGGTLTAGPASTAALTATTLTSSGLLTAAAGLTVSSGTLTAGPVAAGALTASTIGASGLVTAASGLTVSSGTLTAGPVTAGAVSASTITTSGAGSVGGTLTVAGVTSFNSNAASSSTTTGAVVVTGGVGIGGALNVGGAVKIGGALTFNDGSSISTATVGTPIVFQFSATYTSNTWFNFPEISANTGVYMLSVRFHSAAAPNNGGFWYPNLFGILSWYSGTNDASFCSDIPLSSSGHAYVSGRYAQLRVCCRAASTSQLRMLLYGETMSTAVTFKVVMTPLPAMLAAG